MAEAAVIPAAGLGTRMTPLSPFVPKEMFPLCRMPLIEHVVAELSASGIRRICIVIRQGKEIIKEYLASRESLYGSVSFQYAVQASPLGLGDALRSAASFIGDEPFLMAIPDQILLSEVPAARQILESGVPQGGIVNSMVRLSGEDRKFFGGARSFSCDGGSDGKYVITSMSEEGPGPFRGFGRTIFPPEALDYMTADYIGPGTGEVDLLRSFEAMAGKYTLHGVLLDGIPCDLGTWEGYEHYRPIVAGYLKEGGTRE